VANGRKRGLVKPDTTGDLAAFTRQQPAEHDSSTRHGMLVDTDKAELHCWCPGPPPTQQWRQSRSLQLHSAAKKFAGIKPSTAGSPPPGSTVQLSSSAHAHATG
jgi:hypothetical protein